MLPALAQVQAEGSLCPKFLQLSPVSVPHLLTRVLQVARQRAVLGCAGPLLAQPCTGPAGGFVACVRGSWRAGRSHSCMCAVQRRPGAAGAGAVEGCGGWHARDATDQEGASGCGCCSGAWGAAAPAACRSATGAASASLRVPATIMRGMR